MKIKIICDEDPIRVHHDPLNILYNKKANAIEIIDPDTNEINETFLLVKKELAWKSCTNNSNYEEIHALFWVKSSPTQVENN